MLKSTERSLSQKGWCNIPQNYNFYKQYLHKAVEWLRTRPIILSKIAVIHSMSKAFNLFRAEIIFIKHCYQVSSLHIYTFVESRAFMPGAASQAGDADSSRAPGLTSGLQGSVNVHRGALMGVPQ